MASTNMTVLQLLLPHKIHQWMIYFCIMEKTPALLLWLNHWQGMRITQPGLDLLEKLCLQRTSWDSMMAFWLCHLHWCWLTQPLKLGLGMITWLGHGWPIQCLPRSRLALCMKTQPWKSGMIWEIVFPKEWPRNLQSAKADSKIASWWSFYHWFLYSTQSTSGSFAKL